MIHFDLPKEQSSIIKVIGVGGGGSNAVNYMFNQGIDGVNFIICNTDAQALALSRVPNKIQLGPALTQGLGAGANPEIGKQATEESIEEIRRILEVNTKMVFITAGMGGGTGTGGAPIVAKICRDLGILTVAIVTTPFSYEGRKRIQHADEGIGRLKDYVDTMLVISNDKLRHQFGNLTMRAAFSTADNVLATAAKCITDVISSTGQINVDFADVCTVMRSGGVAILGNARAAGENRAQRAIEQALNSPLLNDNDIRGAKWILININSGEGEHEFTMDEVEIIQQHLIAQAGHETDVILGLGYDSDLADQIGITLIATGFDHRNPFNQPASVAQPAAREEKIILRLEDSVREEAAAESRQEPSFEIGDPFAPVLTDLNLPEAPVPTLDWNNLVDTGGINPVERYELHPLPSLPENELLPNHSGRLDSDAESHKEDIISLKEQEASTTPTSGGFLAKPSNIYAEEPADLESEKEIPKEEPHRLVMVKEEDPSFDMQLVIKENPAADDKPGAHSTVITMASVEEPALQDEAEEQKRKAAERLHKLRNLSFNIHAADPNNEFENVPAYVRRNLQVHNTALTSVEKFYSNYTVKTDENNQTEISTLNTFLEGKKPD